MKAGAAVRQRSALWIRPLLLERRVVQVACGRSHSLLLLHQGSLAALGNNAKGQIGDGGRDDARVPKAVALPHGVSSVACGAYHSLAITAYHSLAITGIIALFKHTTITLTITTLQQKQQQKKDGKTTRPHLTLHHLSASSHPGPCN
ncbi:hypothetical protein ACOMHN_047103 [Nucella lapillus]